VTEFSIDLAALGLDDIIHPCGGLRKAVRVTRLPDDPRPPTLTERVAVPLVPGEERCLFVRTVFEDGHIAWTSPIYLRRNGIAQIQTESGVRPDAVSPRRPRRHQQPWSARSSSG
jgi:hypothetical protein